METRLLLPEPDEDSAPFWDGTRRGELLLQRCKDCGRPRFPPRPMCPECQSLESVWTSASGRGRIWSFVVSHPPLLPAYAELAPYPVVVVELEEHPSIRMVGNVVVAAGAPINSVDPALLKIGLPVRVTFEAVSDDTTLPRWILAV